MIAATGEALALIAGTFLIAMVIAIRNTMPSSAAVTTDPTMARGTLRNGSLASSARFAAESQPTSVTPREVRLATAPLPLMTTVMMSPITTSTTTTSSTPTPVPSIMLTMRVEATASTAWRNSTTSVIRRAVPSSGAMPASGMNAWLARALSTATTAIARYQKLSQPNPQPTFALASREAHWYEEPLSEMRAANCAITRATRVCPAATMGRSQIPTGPALLRTTWYVVKTPTATEMKANEIANT